MRLKFLRFSKATLLKVIGFVVVSLLFTAALAVKIGNLHPFTKTYTLRAEFADAAGVFKGDAVKLAGVDVGRISGARIEDGRAVLTFTVDRNVEIPRDSVVALRWRNVLGLRNLYVYPGLSHTYFRDGQLVPLSQTEDAADLGELLNKLGPILKAIDPMKANAFLDAMNTALAGNEGAVRVLFDNGAVLASRLAAMDRQIQSTIGSSDVVTSTYASQGQAIARILDNLNVLGARLQGMTGDINSVLTNFTDVQQQLTKLLRNSRGNIDATLAEAASVLGTIAGDRQRLATTLCTLPAGVAPYFITTSWGQWFNVRITSFTLRDNQDRLLFQSSELPNERAAHGQPKPWTCGGVPVPGPGNPPAVQVGPLPIGNGALPGIPSLPPLPNLPPLPGVPTATGTATGSLGGLVGFVLGGSHG